MIKLSIKPSIAPVVIAAILVTIIAIATTTMWSKFAPNASAANAADFNPGRIIDDSIFYNGNSMTASQIQTFLNSKMPSCDTQGAKNAGGAPWYRSDISRATLASYIRNGTNGYSKNTDFHAPPYTCLRNFKQNTPQVEAASGLGCSALPAYSNRTAAQIIYDVSKSCGINPQVLLVLLQKEQSLVTDDWPLNLQYQRATGFDCPDNVGGSCNPAYNGFFRQVYSAAKQFKIYKAYPNNYNYIAGRTNNILWQTNGGSFINASGSASNMRDGRCGYSQVNIQNQATAALYIYTPYRPNGAALNNYPGTGDTCSAYGNRNFWFMFSNWFGNTQGASMSFSGIKFTSEPFSNKDLTATFAIKNTSKSTINLGRIKIEARSADNTQYDFGDISDITIKPGATFTYKKTRSINAEGQFRFFVSRYHNNRWMNPPFEVYGINNSTQINVVLKNEPIISKSLQLSTTSLHQNQNTAATFSIKNTSQTQSVNVGRTKVEGRHSDGTQYDFGSTPDNLTLAPGETYNYTSTRSLPKAGSYTFKIMNFRESHRWSSTFPASGSGIARTLSTTVKQPATINSNLELSTTSPRTEDPVTATFSMRNFGTKSVNLGRTKVEGRHSDGTQYDFGSTPDNLTLAPGETYNYTSTRSLPKAGSYTFKIMNFRKKERWSSNFPASEDSAVKRSVVVNAKYSATLSSSLEISNTSPRAGESITAEFTLRNFGTKSVNLGRTKVEGRHSDGTQYDFGSTPDNLTLAPGETYNYTSTRSLPKAGSYTFKIMNFRKKERWSSNFPASEDSAVKRSVSLVAS